MGGVVRNYEDVSVGSFRLGDLAKWYDSAINDRITLKKGKGRVPGQEPLEIAPVAAHSHMEMAGLLAGHSPERRSKAVEAWLEANEVPHTRQHFRAIEKSGTNYVADVGDGPDVVVFCAHHDPAPGSYGANDNAASVAVLMSVVRDLTPVEGATIRFIFTDHEERSYLGARQYVRTLDRSERTRIKAAVSVELAGIGDAIVFKDGPSELTERLAGVLTSKGLAALPGGKLRAFGSDHRPFRSVGVKDAVILSVLPTDTIEEFRRIGGNPFKAVAALAGSSELAAPFDTYHTPADSLDTLQPAAMSLAEAGVRQLIDYYTSRTGDS